MSRRKGKAGGQRLRLADIDLDRKLKDEAAYQRKLKALQLEILVIQQAYQRQGRRAIIVLEGWDAAGKGGLIRRLSTRLDPRHCRVWPIGPPTKDEQGRHYLYRFWRKLPPPGTLAVFDRSWYGRVLVERIEGFATTDQWSRAYEEIVSFERSNVLEGVIILKLWLHISHDEQLKRFEDRQNDPLRRWKITDEDWRNRTKATEYLAAAEEMFERTDHHLAPWDVISGEQKRLARVQVLETAITRIEQGITRWGMTVPAVDDIGQVN
jgi:AMP-polyphosphate phosphotransferase